MFNFRLLIVLTSLIALGGCALGVTRGTAVPTDIENKTVVLGMGGIRYWGDEASPELLAQAAESLRMEQERHLASGQQGPMPAAQYLAISGGGENGAFGAGLLAGWSATGTRPTFKLVTGISTGALIAPFAFLGPGYDAPLRQVYTELTAADVLVPRGYISALTADSLADTKPLRQTIARFVDQKMFDAIAAEHAKGRVLLIGTTNLDARRPVIWNIGRLAESRHPGALALFHDILIASAALPGLFPPVMVDVEVDGKRYQEMHVDGGAAAQVFVYPPELNLRALDAANRFQRERKLYVIRNARLDPDWAEVERWTLSIAQRAISSLIQTQGVGDLYRIYLTARRDSVDFNLAYIPETFRMKLEKPFDPAYMKPLFQVGYDLATKGQPWEKLPPGFEGSAADGSAGRR
jgi:hypothetical protein